jgi:phosphoserine phosphatase RsbU/P
MGALPRILIAEDEKVSLLQLQRFLTKELEVEILVAHDGEEAWELFQANDVQFVISDWEMPRCNGPELCRRVREHQGRYTYFILLTARERGEDLLAGMASGADDFVRKPPNFDELKSRIKAGFRVIELEQRLAAQNAKLQDALQELQTAVTAAGQVQQRMLPYDAYLACIRTTTGLSIAYRYESCESLGGDVFSVDQLDNGQVAVFLGDVSGHGIAASLAAVSLTTCVRTNIRSASDPVHLVHQANTFCCSEFPEEVYASTVYLLADPASASLKGVIAGHPALILLRPDGKVKQIGSSIAPLGLFPDPPVAGDIEELVLSPGERLVAYTDGIIETRSPTGEMFSVEQLIQSLRRAQNLPLQQLADNVLADAARWRGPGEPVQDDITVVALEFGAPNAS